MLTSCLIFLYIGLFASCMPTTKPPGGLYQNLKLSNEEIQILLQAIKNDNEKQVATMAPSNKMEPVLMPVSAKECAKLKLQAFIQLLNRWNFESHKEITNLCNRLEDFEKMWTPQEKSDQKCETEEYVDHGFEEFIDDLMRFMRELYCIQTKCK